VSNREPQIPAITRGEAEVEDQTGARRHLYRKLCERIGATEVNNDRIVGETLDTVGGARARPL
jgi:hypothetical protein